MMRGTRQTRILAGLAVAIVMWPARAMDFVVVGDPGNEPDPLYAFGAVPYVFEIGRFEITNEEYAEFLNATASREDPYGLYNPCMSTGLFGGIEKLGDGYPCRYQAKPGWERRPVVYLSWYDLARLANWFHYGNPSHGAPGPGVTEGTDTEGAYDTRGFPHGADAKPDPERLPPRRNPGALYWIPSEDEWYKAAYFDPTRYGKRRYWDYPVRSDDPPRNPPPPGDARSANYFNGVFALGKPWFLAEVGSYPEALSYYGTYDQGGNVWEWVEDWRRKGQGWRDAEAARGLRGGSATYAFVGLHASNTDPGNPSHEMFVFGGRLARAARQSDGAPILPVLVAPNTRTGPWERIPGLGSRKGALVVGALAGFAAGCALGAMVGLRLSTRRPLSREKDR